MESNRTADLVKSHHLMGLDTFVRRHGNKTIWPTSITYPTANRGDYSIRPVFEEAHILDVELRAVCSE